MKTKTIKMELPPDVKASDLKYPSYDSGDSIGYRELEAMGLHSNSLTFYLTTGFGWAITTLGIRNAKPGRTARTYAVTLDGKCCRVGSGPHVKATVTVYLSKSNLSRLQKYVDLHLKGQEQAGIVRDRISTRRAQGQINRANGLSSWRW
jgi:hypothetical protein